MHADDVEVLVDGRPVRVAAGVIVVAALVQAELLATRTSVSGEARFALCGMGHCQECRVAIDGIQHRLACQVRCRAGMCIDTSRKDAP